MILAAVVVLGGVFLLTLMQPGPMVEGDAGDYDSIENTAALLREAEALEKEFEKQQSIGGITPADVDKLRRAIKLRETYMSVTGSVDRLQNNRLIKSQSMLQNIDAKEVAERVAQFEKKAESIEKVDSKAALDLYNEAYALQNRINSEFSLSEYKNVQKVASLERKMRMIAAKPLFDESMEAEKAAYDARDKKRWSEAQAGFEKAIEKFIKLSIEYPNTSYVDFARLKRLEQDLDSLKSMPLEASVDSHLSAAKEAEKSGDFMRAADEYVAAAQDQRKLNSLYPKSARASDEAAKEYMRQRDRVYSSRFGAEILSQKYSLDKLLYEASYRDVAEISSNLIRKVERFKSEFKDSTMLSENLALELRYINYMVRDLPQILEYVNKSAVKLDGFGNIRMFATEIPQDFYFKIMQDNPSRVREDKLPVESVLYEDAEKFCQRLSWILGRKVSLPSLEMYKAALGSMKYADLNAISWNITNSGAKTHSVGTKQPNMKGFYDILGNVSEFVGVKSSSAHETSFKTVGGNAQTQTDSLMDFPVMDVGRNVRSRMTGFRIIIDDTPPTAPGVSSK